MNDSAKQVLEIASNNPKVQLTFLGFFSSPFWIDYGSHAVTEIGKVISLFILVAMLVKHLISTGAACKAAWKSWRSKGDK